MQQYWTKLPPEGADAGKKKKSNLGSRSVQNKISTSKHSLAIKNELVLKTQRKVK